MSEWVRAGEDFASMAGSCEVWQKDVKDGHLTVIVGRERGVGWHLSITHRTKHHPPRPGRYPRWGEISEARYRFTPPGVTMCMILPPPETYVNVHETCFHLWEHQGPGGQR